MTTGFTAGIAVVIATLQLKDFLGLSVAKMPETYLEKVASLARALPTLRWQISPSASSPWRFSSSGRG